MSKNLEVEICCGSYYDTLQAWKGGAKRVELNSALHLGGLTPVSYTHLDVYKRQHMMLGDKEAAIKGSSGTVKDGIMPGYFGYEAGQSCVGDHFAWFVENCVPESYEPVSYTHLVTINQPVLHCMMRIL